jgi:hypothetical protein
MTPACRMHLELPVAKSRVLVSRSWALRLRALVPVLIVSLSVGGAAAGCSSEAGSSMTEPGAASQGGVTPAVAVPMGSMTMPTAEEITTTWDARPAYVNALPADWQAAYSFALARPDVLQWLPCYCGCDGISHRSNLDCFFQRREVKGTYAYEEHASYCDICVRTANMASDMLEQGKTMVQIRAAVDSTFSGGAAPGTDTPMPPA